MKQSKIFFAVFSVLFGLSLCSCSFKEPDPYAFFETFSRYKSDDGVLTFDVDLSDRAGHGKIRLDGKDLKFKWSRYRPNYGLSLELENGGEIVLELESIELSNGRYSKDSILAVAIDPYGVGENVDLIRWSSPIYKEKNLSDSELDAKDFPYVRFRNGTMGLYFEHSAKEMTYQSSNYTLTLLQEERFLIERKNNPGKVEGSYNTSRKYLYLNLERDELFGMEGRILPLTMEEDI